MVSNKHKFIFVHIPKTAGVTISSILDDYCTLDEKKKHNMNPHGQRNQISRYFKFCFVRNPWDRFLSCYFYFRKYGRKIANDTHSGEIVNRFDSFYEFTINFTSICTEFRQPHWNSQLHWLKSRIDFIGRFETLQKDFNIICDKIGISQEILPHVNKSEHKHYTEYYDEDTKEIVAEKYAKDIEYFGYEFGE